MCNNILGTKNAKTTIPISIEEAEIKKIDRLGDRLDNNNTCGTNYSSQSSTSSTSSSSIIAQQLLNDVRALAAQN